MTNNYWNKYLEGRLNRRRLMRGALAGGVAVSAIGLVGCGSDDSGGGGIEGDASGLLTEPVDTTARAKRGTTLPLFVDQDIPQFNTEGNGAAATAANHAYSRIVRFKSIKYPEPRSAQVEGDAAESWEVSGDGMTYTFKMRPNQKLDPRSPTNGRLLDSGDVKFSWDRFASINPYGPNLAAEADPSSPVLGIETPDKNTFVMKLAYPYAGLLPMFAFTRHMVVLPVEADNGFDTGHEVRGSGAWRVREHVPSARIVYEANPDWYDHEKMLPGAKSHPIIGEYNTLLAQFRAGAIATVPVQPEDILPTKNELAQLNMFQNEEFTQGGQSIRFGWIPENPLARDERLRQAVSMLIDRDLFIDTFYNTERFRAAGLEQRRRWHTVIPVGYDDFWLDPQDEAKFGENAKYYQYNPAEAKKLVSAVTGGALPLETEWTYNTDGYGAEFNRMGAVLQQMWESNGDFKFQVNNPPYRTEWRNAYNRNYGRYQGMTFGSAGTGTPDVDGQIVGRLLPDTDRTGNILLGDNQVLRDFIADQRKEIDPQRRQSIIYDLQRYAAKKMIWLMDPGEALSFTLAWPWYGNFRVYRNWTGGAESTEVDPHTWLDESKRNA